MDEQGKQMNEQTAHGTSVMVSHGRENITTVEMFDQSKTKGALLLADKIATSSLIPEHYQMRSDNVLVAIYRSARLGMDVFAYMETTYPVNGRLGHEAKFIVSLINKSGKFKTPLLYRFEGEIIRNPDGTVSPTSTRKCTAYAILKDSDIEVSQSVDIAMAFREGWITKQPKREIDGRKPLNLKSNKWQSMTDEMLQYRSGKFFGNMYCPELVMGLNTREELEDISDAEVIEETEEGRDIFENGKEVDTTPEKVLDPALEVKQEQEIQSTDVKEEPVFAEVVETVAIKPETDVVPPDTSKDKNPPTDATEFKTWFLNRFKSESQDLDVVLLSKKWLTMGQTAEDLTDSKLKNLRTQWDRFLKAYESFKKARHS